MKPKVLIRVDASTKIGFGHLARCLNLAETFSSRDAEITIVTGTPEAGEHIRGRYPVLKPNVFCHEERRAVSVLSEWDVLSTWSQSIQVRDWLATQSVLPAKNYDLVVIDHYGLDANWHSLCRTHAKRVLVIDDLANRHLDCDFLLDSNCDDGLADRYSGLISSTTEKLLGPKYLLKSRALIEVASQVDSMTPDDQSVSICFGGSDPLDYSAAACQTLASLPQNWKVECIIGPQYRNVQSLALTLANLSNFSLAHHPKDIFKILARSQVSVGAAGGMMLERLLLMIPSLVVAIAKNQLNSVDRLCELGAICLIQPEVVSSPSGLVPKVIEMANDEFLRRTLRDLSHKLFGDTRTYNLVAGILD